ncbi:MAG: hypothetical protein UT86_C0004G0032 [Candidatus Magasanikbacteria bacterium GW2011_GWC2_40_17]|uniref:Outer membrane protein beta-barrel domain-containing protein n=1 Tax=Candidatus Magasanikbacteria bacterium GW2011_GWA2_42_32 TaxID=1619039 RepID=A0A0G1A7S0_9BACT|nr:MAG: hypothetical protein UT86_C0004G0032 [Candidatus Magasanikbacteria bacterium GW2011_GWC2_40_17]KKS57092.1 MAG: hypothetical protein UV20_C0003G0032 [Candidatus Magasanikbacteria bacterium GW2011_GWA2_42_32]
MSTFIRVLVAAVVFGYFSTLAKAAEAKGATTTGFLETQVQLDKDADRPVPILDVALIHNFQGGWGLQGFFLVTDAWAQGYIGPNYKPVDWFLIGLYVGAEQGLTGKLQARYSTWLWLGWDIYSLSGAVELNNAVFQGDKAGVWYDVVGKLNPSSWLGAGLRMRRFIGFGPYAEFSFAALGVPLTLWLNYTPVDQEGLAGYVHKARGLLGLSANF